MQPDSDLKDLESLSIQRCQLVDIQGVPLPKDTVDSWDEIWRFQARPDDLVICTYPKAGTTWIQEIVTMIQHQGDSEKCDEVPIERRMPFIELVLPKPFPSDLEEVKKMPSPRSLKFHLPFHLMPPSIWEQNCKVIYVARNAKDNAVSYFHFHRMNMGMPEPGNWDQFVENFIAAKVAWGSWSHHVRGWWEAKDRHPILYLFYEDMKEDLARETRKVAKFLGVELSEAVLKKIVQHTTFENMKSNPNANYSTAPSFVLNHSISPFMRKGTVGDWKDHFTVAQSERLDEVCDRELEGSGLAFRMEL
ncbi:sulfotransferase 1C2-like [Paroedura picta]|uniref:sulfotransferase 1C2-like n=1 Tax=Paroedura picta TaxID=143630 RepID=UPI0040572522